MKKTCIQCGKEFELPQSEVDFYTKKNLSIPKRCKDCRDKNRKAERGGHAGTGGGLGPGGSGSGAGNRSGLGPGGSGSGAGNRSGLGQGDAGSPFKVPAFTPENGYMKYILIALVAIVLVIGAFFLREVLSNQDASESGNEVRTEQGIPDEQGQDQNLQGLGENQDNQSLLQNDGGDDMDPAALVKDDAENGDLDENGEDVGQEATPEPNVAPTEKPTPEPAVAPTEKPTPEQAVAPTEKPTPEPAVAPTPEPVSQASDYRFRNKKLLGEHYEKHGIEMGFASQEEYEAAAAQVVVNPNALHKTEAEDGDDIYYLESTNEFVVVSTDGYIRTYFLPSAGKKYYDRQ